MSSACQVCARVLSGGGRNVCWDTEVKITRHTSRDRRIALYEAFLYRYIALYCAIFQPLYLPELPLAEGISASDLEGMQGAVHNTPWQKVNSKNWFCRALAGFRSQI